MLPVPRARGSNRQKRHAYAFAANAGKKHAVNARALRLLRVGVTTLSLIVMCHATAQAGSEPTTDEPPKHRDATALEANATGFFVNDRGDVLTARHVVQTCQSTFLIKDGQVAPAAATGTFTLTSSATNGANGSPVLDQAGLVVGLVTDRTQVTGEDPRTFVTRSGAAGYVVALSAQTLKEFLAANRIPFTETDTAQLEPLQAHAPRAATLEAGVLCGGWRSKLRR
jgi:hypothetical protein